MNSIAIKEEAESTQEKKTKLFEIIETASKAAEGN